MTTTTGGPAFPGLHPSKECHYQDSGMTLRDYFAAKAMAVYFQDPNIEDIVGDLASVANWCYEVADEMLKAREQS